MMPANMGVEALCCLLVKPGAGASSNCAVLSAASLRRMYKWAA